MLSFRRQLPAQKRSVSNRLGHPYPTRNHLDSRQDSSEKHECDRVDRSGSGHNDRKSLLGNCRAKRRKLEESVMDIATTDKKRRKGKITTEIDMKFAEVTCNEDITRGNQQKVQQGQYSHHSIIQTSSGGWLSETEGLSAQNEHSHRMKRLPESKLFEQLIGGRFRYLNEALYTTKGSDMFQEMQEAPELFHEVSSSKLLYPYYTVPIVQSL